jgi:hypothetical protein
MDAALAVLGRATTEDCCSAWRRRIEELCDALFTSIRLQTSVEKYHASGAERGAVLDFIDHPLNNRWWLEDEFQKVRALPDEQARLAMLERLRTWGDPGPGSFYDDVGNVGASPRVVRSAGTSAEPDGRVGPLPLFVWEQNGQSRARLSSQTTLRWPVAIVYERLDPQRAYTLRLNGLGEARPRIDGQPVAPTSSGRMPDVFKEYAVPREALSDGRLVVTFDPVDDTNLNWRQQSRLSEAWLIVSRN